MNLHIVISGVVQGVGYRQWLRRQAIGGGVTGWVRNRSDGTVEAMLSGPAQAVEGLIEQARHGPAGARVSRIERRETGASSADQASEDFVIAPSI